MTKYVGSSRRARVQPARVMETTNSLISPAAALPVSGESFGLVAVSFARDGVVFGVPLIIEVDDTAAAAEFRSRVCGGRLDGLTVTQVTPHGAVVGEADHTAPTFERASFRSNSNGALVCLGNRSIAFDMNPSQDLIRTHVPCGVVTAGVETLEAILASPLDVNGRPTARTLICSTTIVATAVEAVSAPALLATQRMAQIATRVASEREESLAQTRERLRQASCAVRDSVSTAVKDAFALKQISKAATKRPFAELDFDDDEEPDSSDE